jgi:hypothetical protein
MPVLIPRDYKERYENPQEGRLDLVYVFRLSA